MELEERIKTFLKLRETLENLEQTGELDAKLEEAYIHNPWFIKEFQIFAIQGIRHFIQGNKLHKWINRYNINGSNPKKTGVVMAGNIPLVGFHDFLTVLMAGHQIKIKLSAKDDVLLPYMISILENINQDFKDYIEITPVLKDIDAIIATGSDNSARYFKQYFSKYPHIIRKNRVSIAIMNGKEDQASLEHLSDDVFQYFGMGCRNVAKLFVPENYEIKNLIKAFRKYKDLIEHNKYANNYYYTRSIYLVNKISFLEADHFLLTENTDLVSPISVLYYEYYTNETDLRKKINDYSDKIQCIVSDQGWFDPSIPFGKAQLPEVWDYADNVDTMKFLTGI